MHLFSRSLSFTLLLICLSSTTSYALHEYLCTNYHQQTTRSKTFSWPQFRNKYLLTMASILIGTLTGYLTIYVEQQLGLNILKNANIYVRDKNIYALLWVIFAWHFESDIRKMTIDSVREDIDYSSGTDLLPFYARIASWITYLTISNMPTNLKS